MKARTRRPYLLLATLILLLAAFFRLWHLATVPPGILVEELHNAQLADSIRQGHVSVIYEEVAPGREGLYYALLAVTSAILGRGVMLWRMPSVWLSLLAMAVSFSLMRRLFNGRVGLIVLAYLAFTFWPVWMGRAVLHVSLMPLTIAAFAYMMTRAFSARQPQESGLWFTVAGMGLGIAQYVHVTAWVLLLVMLVFIAYLVLVHRRVTRRQWGNIVYALLLAAVIFIPLFVFILNDPGLRAPVTLREQPGWPAQVPERLLRTLAGLFVRGDSSPDRNLSFRPILDPLSGGLLVVGLGITLARWRRSAYALLPIWLVLGLLPALLLPHAPHFEYMAPVLPVIFAFPALALDELGGLVAARRQGQRVWAGLLAVLVAGNSVWTARDMFVQWPQRGDVRFNYQTSIASLAYYLDTQAGNTPVGMCVTPVSPGDDRFALSSDELLGYFMHRSTLPIRKFDCRQALVLVEGGVDQRLIFLQGHYYDDLPGPLLAWLRYSQEENIPGVPPGVVRHLELKGDLGTFLLVASQSGVAWPPEASGGPGPSSLPARFTDSLRLEAYEVRDTALLPGELPEVTTYWRLEGVPPGNLSLFAHLQSGPGQIVALGEGWGADLSSVQAGDIIVQHNLLTPGNSRPLEPGEYRLAIGLLIPGTEHRLRVLDASRPRSDRLLLQSVQVVD